MRKGQTIAFLLLAAMAGAAVARAPAPVPYLAPGALDLMAVLPPAPVRGTYGYEADRRVFRATRALKDGPRWRLATEDVDVAVPAMLRNFSCAAGVALTPENAPRTALLLARLQQDERAAVAAPKAHYQRQRPFLIDKGPICQPAEALRNSFDYPSGHTTWGWTVALVLAEAAPAHATAILARGRAYGESRVVCGAHNASAITAGRTAGAAIVAALHGVPAFRDDVAAARSELAALDSLAADAPAPDAGRCAADTTLLQSTPY